MAAKKFWRFVGGLVLVGLVLIILSIVLVGAIFGNSVWESNTGIGLFTFNSLPLPQLH